MIKSSIMPVGENLPDIINASNALPIEQGPVIDELRAAIETAPYYVDGVTGYHEQFPRYRFGYWPPTDDNEGKILAEEIIPAQEVLDPRTGERDYFMEHSSATANFHSAVQLVYASKGPLGSALSKFGFDAHSLSLDRNGSRLLAATLPSEKLWKQASQRVSPDLPILSVRPNESWTNTSELEAYIDGQIAVYGSSGMTLNVPAQALLAPEVHEQFREKAQAVLSSDNERSIRHVATKLAGMSLLFLQNNMELLLADSKDTYDDPVAQLGYSLNQLLTEGDEELPDHGLALAQATGQHILRLIEAPISI